MTGYGAVGTQIEIFGKLSILAVSMPVVLALMETLQGFFGMRGRRRLILILAVSAVLIGSGREKVWGQSREEPLWEKGDGQSIWEMEEGGLDWSELEQFLRRAAGPEKSFPLRSWYRLS